MSTVGKKNDVSLVQHRFQQHPSLLVARPQSGILLFHLSGVGVQNDVFSLSLLVADQDSRTFTVKVGDSQDPLPMQSPRVFELPTVTLRGL